jgi:membrane-bound lytic murein transglycosylase A
MTSRLSLALLPLTAGLALAACATGGRPARPPSAPAAAPFSLQPARFSDLPGWESSDPAPALRALRRQCEVWSARSADAPISAGARYGGRIADWSAACAAAAAVPPGGERSFFETMFVPALVVGDPGQARLTGYYEPIIQASRTYAPGFSEPLLRRPSDIVTVDLGAFAEAYDSSELRGAPRTLTGKLYGDRVRPYPSRAEIGRAPPSAPIGYAHPADVYNLQVQGSGRMRFPDGFEARAAFAAQNGYRWRSAIAAAREAGRLQDGSWRGFRAYVDSLGPDAARAALNEDPSYVFFTEETITESGLGPRGAAGVNLTPFGSMAVDPAFHPYGALLYVDGQLDGAPFRRLLAAQDTGGAIRRGPLRGDVFLGSGPDAGELAQRLNAQPVRFWTLIPRGAPIAALAATTPAG